MLLQRGSGGRRNAVTIGLLLPGSGSMPIFRSPSTARVLSLPIRSVYSMQPPIERKLDSSAINCIELKVLRTMPDEVSAAMSLARSSDSGRFSEAAGFTALSRKRIEMPGSPASALPLEAVTTRTQPCLKSSGARPTALTPSSAIRMPRGPAIRSSSAMSFARPQLVSVATPKIQSTSGWAARQDSIFSLSYASPQSSFSAIVSGRQIRHCFSSRSPNSPFDTTSSLRAPGAVFQTMSSFAQVPVPAAMTGWKRWPLIL